MNLRGWQKAFGILTAVSIVVLGVYAIQPYSAYEDEIPTVEAPTEPAELVEPEELPQLPAVDYSCWEPEVVERCTGLTADECFFYSDECEPIIDSADETIEPTITGCQPIDCNRRATFMAAKDTCEAAGQTWIADEVDPYFGDCVCSSVEGQAPAVGACMVGIRDCEQLDDAAFVACRDGGFACFNQHGEEASELADACYEAACAELDIQRQAAADCRAQLDEQHGTEAQPTCTDIILEQQQVFVYSESRCVPEDQYGEFTQQELDWQFSHFAQ